MTRRELEICRKIFINHQLDYEHPSSGSEHAMAKSVAEVIGDIEVEKITGPSDAQALKIGSFWQDQGVVVHFLRRFGCRLCRGYAQELYQIVPTLEASGWRVVAIGIEKLGLEDFQAGGWWNGELYIDNGKSALKALDVKQVGIITAIKDIIMNKDVGEAAKKTKDVPGNFKGDGRQLGATFVFAKGGETLFDHRQKNFGDHPSNVSILRACGIDESTVKQSLVDPSPAVQCDTDASAPASS
ncbi:prostamide/prostaglandin F2alpha synthase [Marchantia polymorpha subsp. ruderalis]|nr:hypothetical protein MARPO_0013s0125 [Marchantia polymorpha]BBN18926.1 hypothetical protein Mp_8g06670 [Marchantia polymorpha subsp. ruderalis]|eukprot:PTQ45918.1 hypothetical protein MARPO_0013s0125 [Marchantia polymorpha]